MALRDAIERARGSFWRLLPALRDGGYLGRSAECRLMGSSFFDESR
jgi:hypothetical protein